MKFTKPSSLKVGIQTKRKTNPLQPNYKLKHDLKTGMLIGADLKNFKIESINKKFIV